MNARRTAVKKPTRRSPITREVGERRLIDAASELLRDGPFSAVGVRDIAARAGVNQGFIHSWFGSRNDLYLKVLQELFTSMMSQIENQPAGAIAVEPFDANVQFAVRLLIWLDLEGADINDMKPIFQKLIDAFARRLTNLSGFDSTTADAVAMLGSAIGLGTSAFGHLIGADDPQKFAQAFTTWQRQLELLAANPSKTAVPTKPKIKSAKLNK